MRRQGAAPPVSAGGEDRLWPLRGSGDATRATVTIRPPPAPDNSTPSLLLPAFFRSLLASLDPSVSLRPRNVCGLIWRPGSRRIVHEFLHLHTLLRDEESMDP